MAISKSITCDRCERIRPISDTDEVDLYDIGCAPGWIRLSVNNPRVNSWSGDNFIAQTFSIDVCSISCASSTLWDMQSE